MFWLKGQRSAQIFGRGIKFIAPQKNLPAHSKHTCPVGVSICTESNRAALAASLLRNGGHQQQPHTHSFPLRCFGNNLTPWHTLSERTFPFSLPLVTATSPTHAARLRSSPPTQPSGRAQTRPKRDPGAPRDEEGSAPLSAPQRIAGKRGGPSRSSCPELNDPPRSAECPARGAAPAKLRDD